MLPNRFLTFFTKPKDRFGLLLLLLIAALLLSGLGRDGGVRLIAGLLNLAILGVAFTSSRMVNRFRTFTIFALAGVAGSVAVATQPIQQSSGAIGASAQVCVLGASTFAVVKRVVDHENVTVETIFGGLSAYMLLGQVFAWVYLSLPGYLHDQVISPAEPGEIPIYYSYVVLTTLGFGDINPVGQLARRITVLQALVGQVFLAVLIARLVAQYSAQQVRSSAQAEPSATADIADKSDDSK